MIEDTGGFQTSRCFISDLLEATDDGDIIPVKKAKTFYKSCMDTGNRSGTTFFQTKF